MSEQANMPIPRFVTCRCQHCQGKIEFDANELTEENSIVPCPHCGVETKIFIQELQPDAASTTPTCPTTPATRREGFFCGDPVLQQRRPDAPSTADQIKSTGERQEIEPYLRSEPETHIATTEAMRNAVTPSDNESSVRHKHKRVRFAKGTRIALSPNQCESVTGKELIGLLGDIVRHGADTDGIVTEDGIRRLNAWLAKKADSDILAVKFLLQVSDRILRTGKVTTAKAFEMNFAIERILPVSLRAEFKRMRQNAWVHSPLKPKATDAQLEYIRSLGGDPQPGLNTAEASLIIDRLLEHSTPPSEQLATEKQVQYIRALGGTPSPALSKADASALINQLQAKSRQFPSSFQDL